MANRKHGIGLLVMLLVFSVSMTLSAENPNEKSNQDSLPSLDEFIDFDEEPILLFAPAPIYPEAAKEAGKSGDVWIKALVDTNGSVSDAVVARGSGFDVGFEEAALEAAKKRKYRPAHFNNYPVAVWVAFKIRFQSGNNKKSEGLHTPNLNLQKSEDATSDLSSDGKSDLPEFDEFVAFDEEPVLFYAPDPVYPDEARRDGLVGTVWVKVLIGIDGLVKDAIIIKESGTDAGFEQAALATALKRQYKPARLNDKPIAAWVAYKVKFDLNRK